MAETGKHSTNYPQKWRPTLGMIVTVMLLSVLSLPISGFWLFRFYDTQLVQETEGELIVQGALIQSMVVKILEREKIDPAIFKEIIRHKKNSRGITKGLDPQLPELDLTHERILPRRSAAKIPTRAMDPVLSSITNPISEILKKAQNTTLAGYRIVDTNGIVVGGSAEIGKSLSHVEEIHEALSGDYASVIRERRAKGSTPPIYSISRGTNIRVFVAMPILYNGRIAGAVYLSRTPSHFLRELYGQLGNVFWAILFVATISFFIALIFVRTIKGPIDALNERTKRLASGNREALEPLDSHGSREIASLSQGLLSMAEKLQDRTDYIKTFANHVSHELKSPLTSIQGAAELINDGGDDMGSEDRERFLGNIMKDTERLTKLLDRLRELAAAERIELQDVSNPGEIVQSIESRMSGIQITYEGDPALAVQLSSENLEIVFMNLLENAKLHKAKQVKVRGTRDEHGKGICIIVSDDGTGISAANRNKVFDPFFTTRRENGGTGMGLAIIQSMLTTHGGNISLLDCENGTAFEIRLPMAPIDRQPDT